MSIQRKLKAIAQLYSRLEKETLQFQSESKLKCLTGCSKCCEKADIYVVPLEFLPLAHHYYLTGVAEQMLEEIEKKVESGDLLCHLLAGLKVAETKGFCTEYTHRALTCRLFGFAAFINKQHQKELVTCRLIKENQPEEFTKATNQIKLSQKIPVWSDYYSQMQTIDPVLGTKQLPINEAALEAIRYVIHYYSYRSPRKKVSKAS